MSRIKLLEKTFMQVNNDLFNGELEQPEFCIVNKVEMIGLSVLHFDKKYFEWEGLTVSVYGRQFVALHNELTGLEAFYAFVHELVHVWQAQTGQKLDHGKVFNKKCLEAYEFYNIGEL